MALTSSLLLLLGSVLHWLLHRRAVGVARLLPMGAVGAALVAVLFAGPTASTLSIWRPAELFGPGFEFKLDQGSRPFLLLACSLFLAECLRRGARIEPLELAGWGLGLAAGLGSNPLSVALSWTLLSACEASLELNRGAEPSLLIRRGLPHVGAALLLVAFEAYPPDTFHGLPAGLAGVAILLRCSTLGDREANQINGFALLNPIVALAAGGQLLSDPTGLALPAGLGLLWWLARMASRPTASESIYPALAAAGLLITGTSTGQVWRTLAAAAVAAQLAGCAMLVGRRRWVEASALGLSAVAVLVLSHPNLNGLLLGGLGLGLGAGGTQVVRRVFLRLRPDRGGILSVTGIGIGSELGRIWAVLARWIRSGTELLEGQSAVLWMFLALLAIVVAIRGSPG